MNSTVIALVLLGASMPAFAAPCTVDPKRAHYGAHASVGGALICNGKNLNGMFAMIDKGDIVGLSWRQYEGNKDRTMQIYDTGQLFFLIHDDAIQGGFSAKTRAVNRHVFPRGKKMRVEANGQGEVVVHDSAGNAWTLAVTPWKTHDQSFETIAVNGKKQQLKKMDFTVPGIVGIDASVLGPLVLHKVEPYYQNMTDVRTPQYHKTKSFFVDGKGTKCELENKLLFGPAPTDPNDKFENAFLFPDDKSLRHFLTQNCPKLDISVLPP